MPIDTKRAVEWALKQYEEVEGYKIHVVESGKVTHSLLVDFVSKYFNEHGIEYDTYSFPDLIPYIPDGLNY